MSLGFVARISISNNDYFRFMIPTKTRLINLKTGAINVASIGQAGSAPMLWIILDS